MSRAFRLPTTVLCLLAASGIPASDVPAVAQSYSSGQNVSPAYEGWEQNADGSFNFLFGYMDRNWEEEIDVPVGPDNGIEPGGLDQGQPTRFLPGATDSCSACKCRRISATRKWSGRSRPGAG